MAERVRGQGQGVPKGTFSAFPPPLLPLLRQRLSWHALRAGGRRRVLTRTLWCVCCAPQWAEKGECKNNLHFMLGVEGYDGMCIKSCCGPIQPGVPKDECMGMCGNPLL